jgi:hypothetical protein
MMSNENEGNICNKYDDVAAAIVKHDDDSFNDFPDLGGEARSLLASIYHRYQAFRVGGVDPNARLLANKNGTGAKARRMRRPAEGDGLSVISVISPLA